MDESKRHLYRLDPVKLQQKIYDMYPANSVTRKRMVSDIKRDQLSYYTRLLQDMPVQAAQTLMTENRKTIIKFSISATIFTILGALGLFSSLVFQLSMLESILLGVLGGLSLGMAVAQAKILFSIKESSDNFTKAVSGIQKKIDDLRQDL